MDTLEAITKIIGSLAWPVLVGIIIFVFRSEIRKRIKNITSLKAGGAEIAFSEKIQATVVDLVTQTEKLHGGHALPEDERQDAVVVLNAALSELAALVKAKHELASNLEWTKLTPGRELILRMVVMAMGPERAAATPVHELQEKWPELSRNAALNGGAITGLNGVGIVDSQNRLTNIGAELIRALAREIIAHQKLPV